jgi:hypothetical protein
MPCVSLWISTNHTKEYYSSFKRLHCLCSPKVTVPFFLSHLPMAEEFFRFGIWRCGKSPGAKTCYTFNAISSTEHQAHVGLLIINALRHDTNVTLGMERTILLLLSCPRQSAALLLCHCGSHSPKRLTDWRAETFADFHVVSMSVVSM